MGTRSFRLGLLLHLLLAGVASAAPDDHAPHEPAGVDHSGHAHAHPHIDLHHGIVTESPVPETEMRFTYSFVRGSESDQSEHAFLAGIEYAFVKEFSLELAAPFSIVDPENGGLRGGLAGVEITAKYASYQFTDLRLLPAVGVAILLPAGDEERGIGSDHVFEVEPFIRVGYWYDRFQAVAIISAGLPFNRSQAERNEDEDYSFEYNLALFYELTPRVQAVVELHGESAFGGGEGNEHAFYISPGVTFQPLKDASVNFGVGVSLPLTDDREFDYAVNTFVIIHL